MSSTTTNVGVPSSTYSTSSSSELEPLHDWLRIEFPSRTLDSGKESGSSSGDSDESGTCNEEIVEWTTSTWESSSTLSAASTTLEDLQPSTGNCESMATTVSDDGDWGWDSMGAGNHPLTAPTAVATWDNSVFEREPEPTDPSRLTINRFTLTADTHPTLFSLLTAPTWSLSLSPASKHALITSLKRLLEHACFSIVDLHAPFELVLLSLNTYDAVDINVWIALLHKLRSESKDSENKGAGRRKLDASLAGGLPNVNVYFEKEIDHDRDTIGRLRHAAVHRWDYDSHLIHRAVAFLATLRDEKRIAEFEELAQAAMAGDLKLEKRCSTKHELLTYLVNTLEEAFYRFAKVHDPDLDIEHAHALELHDIAEKVIGRLYELKVDIGEVRKMVDVCRALRNMEAHHNSFSKEAIEGRKNSSTVRCMYDNEDDPYKALAKDAERVALMLGDKSAAREIRLALWAADVGLRDTYRIGDEDDVEVDNNGDDEEGTNYLDHARLAAKRRPKPTRDMPNHEGDRTVYQRYNEAIAYHERCAADLFPEIKHVFERWSQSSVVTIVDPRQKEIDEAVDNLDWTTSETAPTPHSPTTVSPSDATPTAQVDASSHEERRHCIVN